MTVTLGDTEAERIAEMLEALSALDPEEGMKPDAEMYADELRYRTGNPSEDGPEA